MKKLGLVAVMCTLGVGACSQSHEPSDDQLALLLQGQPAAQGTHVAQLDPAAIRCLRAWSGDPTLQQKLPPNVTDEAGRATCHTKLDALIADAARNPDKFTFADLTTPAVVRRAVALEEARKLKELSNPGAHEVPPALMRPAAPPATFGVVDAGVDLGVAGAKLVEAEDLCRQTQQAAAQPGANPRLTSFARFCVGNLRQLRGTMQQAARAGQDQKRLDTIAASASNLATVARNLLASGQK